MLASSPQRTINRCAGFKRSVGHVVQRRVAGPVPPSSTCQRLSRDNGKELVQCQRRWKSRHKRRQQDHHMSRGADEGIRKEKKKTDCDAIPRSSWAQRKHTSPPKKKNQPRTKKPINNDGGVTTVPTRPGQTERPTMGTQLFRSPIQDCARVFPVKGARDALRNLEPGVRAIDGTRPCTLTRDPRDNRTKSVGPSTAQRLKNERTESDACLGAL